MADAPETPTPPAYRNSEAAPFVYFDIVPTFGVFGGAVQIELASRVLVPAGGAGVTTEFMVTGRLRCSPAAANHLRETIDKALQMFDQPLQQSGSGSATLN